MAERTQIAELLNQTLSSDANAVRAATDALDRLSLTPYFPFHLLSISTRNSISHFRVFCFSQSSISRILYVQLLFLLFFFFWEFWFGSVVGAQKEKIKVRRLLLLRTWRISRAATSIAAAPPRLPVWATSSRSSWCKLCFKSSSMFWRFWLKWYDSYLVSSVFFFFWVASWNCVFLLCIWAILWWQFRSVAGAEFVKQNSWPELVPNLQSAIQNSNLINGSSSTWSTINALVVLHALLRPFQVFKVFFVG